MTYSDFQIDLGGKTGEEVQVTCPQCSSKRKNAKARCLSVNTSKGVWICHHCDWRGSLKSGEDHPGKKLYVKPTWSVKAPTRDLYAFFALRGIFSAIVDLEGIVEVSTYLPQCEDYVPCIAFPYRKHGDVVNIKYRALKEKAFRQVTGAEKVLYRQDWISKTKPTYIVEGELDALSIIQAGIMEVVSVPDGAPVPTAKNYTSKFTYLDQNPDPFEDVQSIVLAVDNDEPGRALQRELARRLGTDRCSFIAWPEGCKDANDVLVKHGVETLKTCLAHPKPFPVQDVVEVEDICEEICRDYYAAPSRGLSTGWSTVDQFYTVEGGQLTVVTGVPSSGKSEWLDALALNLALLHGWRFAICSPENCPVKTHCAKLVEKYVGKPYWVGPTARMSPAELVGGLEWVKEYITFIMPEDALTIQGVLDRATVLVRRKGIKGLIIDPFNEFDHTRERGQTETEYIGYVLGAIKRWARKFGVHVWLVAHPQKLYRREDGSYPVPTPYDINGSANFRNKADNCITIWRDMEQPTDPIQVHIQKVRFKHIGTVGVAELMWEKKNGRYSTPGVPQ